MVAKLQLLAAAVKLQLLPVALHAVPLLAVAVKLLLATHAELLAVIVPAVKKPVAC